MSASVPVVWTLDEFEDASTPKTIIERGRDPYLRLVDKALEQFDLVKSTSSWNDKILAGHPGVRHVRSLAEG
jgi:hypothetical protein